MNQEKPTGVNQRALGRSSDLLNIFATPSSYLDGSGVMNHDNKNERVELEMKILKFRQMLFRITDDQFQKRATEKLAELEQKLREIDQ